MIVAQEPAVMTKAPESVSVVDRAPEPNDAGSMCTMDQSKSPFPRTLRWPMVWLGLVAMGGYAGCALGPGGEAGRLRGLSRRGVPWTIRCLELQGPGRMTQIEAVAAALRGTPGIRANDVFVRDDSDGFARLYYGTYYKKWDPKRQRRIEPPQLRSDINLIRELGLEDGRRLFLAAIPVRMPQPDVGNPAWDLRKLDAAYSLQVAVFEPTEEFFEYKQAAADYCKLLRERGYEAYYFHAPASSSVTVGSFGVDAVISRAVERLGRTYYVTEYSDEVRRLQEHELLKYNLLNGAIYRVRNESGLSEPVPSRLVKVPTRNDGDAESVGPARVGRPAGRP